jgi:hypothetical protein
MTSSQIRFCREKGLYLDTPAIPILVPSQTKRLPTVYPNFPHSPLVSRKAWVKAAFGRHISRPCPQGNICEAEGVRPRHCFSVDRVVPERNVRYSRDNYRNKNLL